MRELYIKFLYHTVGNQTSASITADNVIKMLEFGTKRHPIAASDHKLDSKDELAISSSPPRHLLQAFSEIGHSPPKEKPSTPRSDFRQNPDDYLRMAKWKIDDLSFLVGSDLAIFGTKMHPCISLRLSPLHEPINVLTGIDIWLENILNEVPEVAMCFHNEGIVMQEYELFETRDLPKLAGFHTEQILRIVRNLVMFLKRNATQEGHTYWLVKEAGFDAVKLYDLTVLCEKMPYYPRHPSASADEQEDESNSASGVNPFILPVATLCFKLAERRVRQREVYLRRRTTDAQTKPQVGKKSKSSKQQHLPVDDMDSYVKDLRSFLSDVFRLLKNCLNLISRMEESEKEGEPSRNEDDHFSSVKQYIDLKARALLLLCQLYLSTPPEDIIFCASTVQKPTPPTPDTVSVDVAEFASEAGATEITTKSSEYPLPLSQQEGSSQVERVRNKRVYLGDSIIEAFKSPQTDDLSILAMALVESVKPNSLSIGLGCDCGRPWASLINECHQGKEEEQLAINVFNDRKRCANEMLPFVLAKYALMRANRLWVRAFGATTTTSTTVPLSTNVLIKLYEAVQLSFIALFFLEHLSPDESECCPYCHQKPLMPPTSQLQDNEQESHVGLAPHLLLATRRLLVLAFQAIEDARKTPGEGEEQFRSLPPETVGMEHKLLLDTLAELCRPGYDRMLPILDMAINGLSTYEHACRSKPCGLPLAYECSISIWLDMLDIVIHCVKQLLPLSSAACKQSKKSSTINTQTTLSNTTMAALRFLNNFNSQFPVGQLPKFWPITLNLYLAGLRLYWHLLSEEGKQNKAMEDRFIARLKKCCDWLYDPVLSDCTSSIHNLYQTLLCTLKFQSIKLATVAAPQLLAPPDETCQIDDKREERKLEKLPQLMVCLRKAIDALTPAFTICSTLPDADLSMLGNMTNDLLRAAIEYSVLGLNAFFQFKNPPLWLLEDIAGIHRQVQKVIPFQLNILLDVISGSNNSNNSGGGRRKQTQSSTILNPKTLDKSQFSDTVIRCVVYFRLHVVKVALLQFQFTGLEPGRRMCSSLVGQMRTALSWLEKNVSDRLFNKKAAQLAPETYQGIFYDDVLLYILTVTYLVSLQIIHIEILSESGMVQLLQDALLAQPVVESLTNYLSTKKPSKKKINPTVADDDEPATKPLDQGEDQIAEISSTLYQLAKSINSLAVSLFTKVKEKSSLSASGRQRSGKRVLPKSTAPNEALLKLVDSVALPVDTSKGSPEDMAKLCIRVHSQLIAVADYFQQKF